MTAPLGAEPTQAGAADYARPFAAVAGAALVVLGLLGILGNPIVGSVADLPVVVTGPVHDLWHLVLGALYLHVAFALAGPLQANGLLALGGVSLAFIGLTLLSADLFGILDVGTNLPDQLLHLVIGGASVAVGWLLRTSRPVGLPRRRPSDKGS